MIKKTIFSFIPKIVKFDAEKYSDSIEKFSAGENHPECSYFLKNEAESCRRERDGVSYLIFDISEDDKGNLAAFFTISVSAIPFMNRFKLEPEEIDETGKKYDETLCGIPAMQIKMFAVDEKYQKVLLKNDDFEILVSDLIFQSVLAFLNEMSLETVSFSAIYLHSLPNAEKFYERNGFSTVEKGMLEFYDPDGEFKFLYKALRKINFTYEE